MKELTEKQEDTLKYLALFITKNDHSPTVREVARKFDITVKAAADRLNALRKKGYINWRPGMARSIIITEEENE